jgi:transposase
MTGTMTWVGLDVHARSIHAAAIDTVSGELTRARFGGESGPVVEWLSRLPQPVHACYEAGPTGYVLARAATAAGLRVDVVAPTKTPRPRGDRVKTDRKDAELLVRQLLAGGLTAVVVPDERLEAARDLARCREQLRLDLARARHRATKLLPRQGRVYPRRNCTWSQAHRR